MFSQPLSTAPDIDRPASDAAANEDAHYYRRVLHELIDLGAELARLVVQNAKAEAEVAQPVASPPDPTVAFDRISRAIRRTIALARTLDQPAPARAPGVAHDRAASRVANRKRILRDVEDRILSHAHPAEFESLNTELLDRLDAPDLDDDIAQRPVSDIIRDICRDLGLEDGLHSWKRRTPADIAALSAYAALPCSPAPASPAPASPVPASPVLVSDQPARVWSERDPPSNPDEADATLAQCSARFRGS